MLYRTISSRRGAAGESEAELERRHRIETALAADGVSASDWDACRDWIIAQEAAREIIAWEPECAEMLGLRATVALTEDDVDWLWSRTDAAQAAPDGVSACPDRQTYRALLDTIARAYERNPGGSGSTLNGRRRRRRPN